MSDEELDELAADIKANGLQQPIIIDKEGTLIDGRNRLEACRRAGIKPTTTIVNGQDVLAYILSANVYRRNLTKGQIAMISVEVCSETEQPKRDAARLAKISLGRIGQAAIVKEFASELVAAVISGSYSLDDAYQTAVDRKAAANSAEKQLEKLQTEAPDLADLVKEERLKLSDALASLRQRKDDEKKHRQTTSRLFSEAILLFTPQANTPEELADHLVNAIDPGYATSDISPPSLKNALNVFKIVVSKLSK